MEKKLIAASALGSFVFGIAIGLSLTVAVLNPKTETKTVTVEKVVEVVPDNYVDTTSYDFYNNYLDMRQVVDFEATETGLLLHTKDGSGYYWER